MKEMKLRESEEKEFKGLLHNYLVLSENIIKTTKDTIKMMEHIGMEQDKIRQVGNNLKQWKKGHKEGEKAVKYWQQKLDDSDDIKEVYIE